MPFGSYIGDQYVGYAGDGFGSYVGDEQMLGAPVAHMAHALVHPQARPTHRGGHVIHRGVAVAPGRPPIVGAAAMALQQPMGGQPQGGPRLEPLGVPTFSFTATSGTTITQRCFPQKAFKGSEFFADVARTGTTATGLLSVVNVKVGARPILVSGDPLPLNMYAPGSLRAQMMLDVAVPGIIIEVTLQISAAPTMTDRVDVGCSFIGMTWGP